MNAPLTGIIVLAAGGSTRMGRPKQLLQFQGKTLIRRATETAMAVGGPVVVVTGANAELVAAEVGDLRIQIVENARWTKGMGSSIRVGVSALTAARPDLNALLITLCDQVQVSPATLERLILEKGETGKDLCCAAFDGTFGPPVLASRAYFPELLELPDPHGARQILLNHPADLLHVPCPEAALDVDTPADFAAFISPDRG